MRGAVPPVAAALLLVGGVSLAAGPTSVGGELTRRSRPDAGGLTFAASRRSLFLNE